MPSQCPHGDMSSFSHIDCDTGRGPGFRDPTCNICLEPVEEGERSKTHRVCKTTWHAECMNQWIETNIGPYEDNYLVSCPSCRGKIAQYSEYRTEQVGIPDDRTLATLLDGLQEGRALRFVDRRDIHRLYYILQTGDSTNFVATHFTPTNGVIPSHRIPAGRSRGILFNDTDAVEAGVLILRTCAHQTVFLLLTGEQVFNYLSELYAHGWDPATGRKRLRVDLEAMRGQSLPTIMRHALSRGVRDINHFELKYLFPDCRWFDGRTMMHIRLLHTDDRTGRSRVQAIVYDLLNPWEIGIVPREVLFNTIFELGGFGDDFMLSEMTGSEAYGTLFMNVQYMNVLTPFPSARRSSY